MAEDGVFMGHLFYEVGHDASGFYVAIRLERPDRSSRTMVAEARFRHFDEALDFMRALEADAQFHAQLLGLMMVRDESQN